MVLYLSAPNPLLTTSFHQHPMGNIQLCELQALSRSPSPIRGVATARLAEIRVLVRRPVEITNVNHDTPTQATIRK